MGSVTVFEPPASLNIDLTPPLLTAVQAPAIESEKPVKLHAKRVLKPKKVVSKKQPQQNIPAHLQAKDFLSKTKMKQSLKASADKIINPEAGLLGAALSLFWIVIVALLVIYIVGLVLNGYGFGSLIHILGIVVLLLAVLWLLRVL